MKDWTVDYNRFKEQTWQTIERITYLDDGIASPSATNADASASASPSPASAADVGPVEPETPPESF